MEHTLLNSVLSIITLLFIATIITFILKNSKIPFTVALVITGIGLGALNEYTNILPYLKDFKLSPDLVFYMFLPTLIFESSFHMNFKHFTQNKSSIIGLSTLGMLISCVIVAFVMQRFLGFPWEIALLFGSFISATDPISVLSLFKKIGAPKRLATIVEGESLFNDGTALVLFGIMLEIATKTDAIKAGSILGSFESFGITVVGGLGCGAILGLIFSKALDFVKNSKEIEISLTLILAHATFIIAEYFLGVSGILATVAAGIVIGNYGFYKISPGVREIMVHFWDYSAYIANSLLFLLVGLLVYTVRDNFSELLPASIIIIATILVARIIMVYGMLGVQNIVYKKERMPFSWMHVIQWSGLRGALCIALMLTLPNDFPYYTEMLFFTVSVITVTILVNGLTMEPLLEFLKIKTFSASELFEHDENQMLIDKKVQKKLDEMLNKNFITKKVHTLVGKDYEAHSNSCSQHMKSLIKIHKDSLDEKTLGLVLKRHLLGVEKRAFTKLYYHGEITQKLLSVLLNNLEAQLESEELDQKIELGKLTFFHSKGKITNLLYKLGYKKLKTKLRYKEIMLRYEMFRARIIATSDGLAAIDEIEKCNAFLNKKLLSFFKKKYKKWHEKAKEKLTELEKENPKACHSIQVFLAKQAALNVERKMIDELYNSGMTSAKVFSELNKSLNEKVNSAEL